MKTIITALLTLLISQSLIAAAQFQEQKVLYHVNYHVNYHEQYRISETLVNVTNHLEALGEDRVDIKVMIHGKAIEHLIEAVKDEGKQMQLDSLRMSGVQFLVCGNTLNGYNITPDDLYEVESTDMIQAGLPAIVDLQQKGYIYVRP